MTLPRSRHIAAALLLALLLPLGSAGPSEAAPALPKLLGMATANFPTVLPEFERQTGEGPAFFALFREIETYESYGNLGKLLPSLHELGVTGYLELTTEDLDGLTSGALDAKLRRLFDQAEPWLKGGTGRHLVVAPLPEANLSHHAWGGDPGGYKQGYRRIHKHIRDRGLGPDKVRFVFAMNGESGYRSDGSKYTYAEFFPGTGVTDLIGFAALNRGNPWRDYENTFAKYIAEMDATVPSSAPIFITQTASVKDSRRAGWLEDMFRKLKAHDRVIGALYFNRDVSGYDFRIATDRWVDGTVRTEYPAWSPQSESSFLFDGRLDQWTKAWASTNPSGPPGIAVTGDWDGNGSDTPGWFHEGQWRLRNTPYGSDLLFTFGRAGDVPLVGDWNGDGDDEIGIVRNGRWHLRYSLSGGLPDKTFTYGRVAEGDIPLVGDWNDDGDDEIGIVRNGRWHLRYSLSGGLPDKTFTYGRVAEGDIPLVGDWNGNGQDGIGIVRNGRWHLRRTPSGGTSQIVFTYGRVLEGDIPIVGDWDGDGDDSAGIIRNGDWHVIQGLKGGAADETWRY